MRVSPQPSATLQRVREAASDFAAKPAKPDEVERFVPEDGYGGVVAVSQGVLRVMTFDREDDGSDSGYAHLVQRSSVDAGPGVVAGVLPPHDDYHQVQNLTDKLAVSIHTYGADIKSCLSFDVERQTCELLHPVWTKQPDPHA